jgi:hypothetical protein
MARLLNRDAIYHAAELFRDKCLTGKGALTWSGESPWTEASLSQLWHQFVENPDEGNRTFFQKLKSQLTDADDVVLKVAVDILAFYYLYPDSMTAASKLARLREVAGWHGLTDQLDLTTVEAAYAETGIGNPGTYYNTGLPWNFSFLIGLGRAILPHPDVAKDADGLDALSTEVMSRVPSNSTTGMRNVSLYLLLPDAFERLGTDNHKRFVLEAFARFDPKSGSVDARLRAVRTAYGVELGRIAFDFYEPDIKKIWFPKGDAPVPPPRARRVWIEKTIVAGRPDRVEGEHALGHALWSPQRSRSNADIYRTMREVRPGDMILHLTDNEAFTGVSEAASVADDSFTGVAGTEWGNQPGLRVALTGFRRLQPPLTRGVFFISPFKEQLAHYAKSEGSNLFYNSKQELNQGKYLTEAPPPLLTILNAAYRSVAEKDLLDETELPPIPEPPPTRLTTAADFAASCKSFSDALRTSGLAFGLGHDALARSFFVSLATKRFVILTGLSGSGKTQLAIRFGEWIGDSQSLIVPVRPDWTGAESLFGFEDALQRAVDGRKAWQVPETLQFMLRAAVDRSRPYLLVLDEMNLAHVERYFADVLSGMESGKDCLPNLAKDGDGQWRLKQGAREKLPMPTNLFVVGTVNVDETTYMFSPKVLDRANTFEFRVQTGDLNPRAGKPKPCAPGAARAISSFLSVASTGEWHTQSSGADTTAFATAFTKLHSLLAEFGLEYGHRTLTEAMRFAALLSAAGDTDLYSALDLQIMQKILPRLHGSRRRMEPVLTSLGRYCLDPSVAIATEPAGETPPFDPLQAPLQPPKLPMAFDKVRRMISLLRANQFVSFTE